MATIIKEELRAGPFHELFAQGVCVGDTIHLSGAVSLDQAGGVVGVGDLGAQVRQCYANIGTVLHRFDVTFHNLDDETWFVTDMARVMGELGSVTAARVDFLGERPQITQTMVEVAGLVMPELLVEIKCLARR